MEKTTFCNEIAQMMFGFGDSHKPDPETVRLVESITLKQLRIILQEALKYSDENDKQKTLKGKELVFLLRHNKHKMRRFVQYLRNKHQKSIFQSLNSAVDLDNETKPKSELLDFIELIDETGEFCDLSEVDEVKHERILRADRISQILDETRYIEFCKARTASFCSRDIVARNSEAMRKWIDPKGEIVFHKDAMTVLQYFAYQTVAEITDYALLVRMDGRSGANPLGDLAGSYYTATMFNGEHRLRLGSNLDYSKVYSDQPPISVGEVKEVMRRVYSQSTGRLNLGGAKLPETHFLFAL